MALTITCPICGKRNGYEFRFGGEDKGPRPEENGMTPESWCDYVHMNKCVAGVQKEWWFHRDGCGSWFTIHRDTTTNLEVANPETELKTDSKTELKTKADKKAIAASKAESDKNTIAESEVESKADSKTELDTKVIAEPEGKNDEQA